MQNAMSQFFGSDDEDNDKARRGAEMMQRLNASSSAGREVRSDPTQAALGVAPAATGRGRGRGTGDDIDKYAEIISKARRA